MPSPSSIPAPALSEKDFQAQVVELAGICGWRVMHVRRSVGRRNGGAAWQTTTSIKGWPDLFLFHPGRGVHLAAELKSDKGRVSPEQLSVMQELEAAGVHCELWRPAMWAHIQRVLTGAPVSVSAGVATGEDR